MESVQILAQVNEEENIPNGWIIFPLLRQKVLLGIMGWVFGIITGVGLLAWVGPIMIPHNYRMGTGPAVFSTIILAAFLFVALGSLWELIGDVLRFLDVTNHVIVITPDDFVKKEGKKVIHVPLEYVRHVTARGKPPVDRSMESARQDARVGSSGEGIASMIVGRRVAESDRRGSGRKRMRTPTTLAFIDGRTEEEVLVVTDTAYGDPFMIAAHLKEYARAKVANSVN